MIKPLQFFFTFSSIAVASGFFIFNFGTPSPSANRAPSSQEAAEMSGGYSGGLPFGSSSNFAVSGLKANCYRCNDNSECESGVCAESGNQGSKICVGSNARKANLNECCSRPGSCNLGTCTERTFQFSNGSESSIKVCALSPRLNGNVGMPGSFCTGYGACRSGLCVNNICHAGTRDHGIGGQPCVVVPRSCSDGLYCSPDHRRIWTPLGFIQVNGLCVSYPLGR